MTIKVNSGPKIFGEYKTTKTSVASPSKGSILESDKVDFNQDAVMFSDALKAAKAGFEKPVDQSRLAELKSQVQNGTYSKDSMAVAKKILMG